MNTTTTAISPLGDRGCTQLFENNNQNKLKSNSYMQQQPSPQSSSSFQRRQSMHHPTSSSADSLSPLSTASPTEDGNTKTVSAASIAAQNGYFQRKAAKSMLDRRRRASVASIQAQIPADLLKTTVTKLSLPDQNEPYYDEDGENKRNIINVSVDSSGGVRVKQQSSKTFADKRQHGLPNAPNSNSREAFFAKRKSQRDWKPVIDTVPVEKPVNNNSNAGGDRWDGSMPRRHSSRSFIERNGHSGGARNGTGTASSSTVNSGTCTVNGNGTPNINGQRKHAAVSAEAVRKALEQTRSPLVTTRNIHNNDNNNTSNNSNSNSNINQINNPPSCIITPSITTIPSHSPSVLNNMSSFNGLPMSTPTSSEEHLQLEIPSKPVSVNKTEVKTLKPVIIDTPRQLDCAHERHDSCTSLRMPNEGRWCDKCAGVGLMVAALLAEKKKQDEERTRASSDASDSEEKSQLTRKLSGWRTVVMGGGSISSSSSSEKSRLSAENARLIKENKALYDVMHQLQKRFNEHLGNKQ